MVLNGRSHDNNNSRIKIWDLPTRLFHWLLVIAIIVCFVSNKLGITYFTLHCWSGYLVLVLVVFRVFWGLVGPRHAQFKNFVKGPSGCFRYLLASLRGEARRYPGHNPLGALMVLLLITLIFLQAISGLFANDEILNVGPLYGYVSHDTSLQLTAIHKTLQNVIWGAIALHIAAVLFYVLVKKEGLIKAMITGYKSREGLFAVKSIDSSRINLALILVVVSAIIIWAVVAYAPESSLTVDYS